MAARNARMPRLRRQPRAARGREMPRLDVGRAGGRRRADVHRDGTLRRRDPLRTARRPSDRTSRTAESREPCRRSLSWPQLHTSRGSCRRRCRRSRRICRSCRWPQATVPPRCGPRAPRRFSRGFRNRGLGSCGEVQALGDLRADRVVLVRRESRSRRGFRRRRRTAGGTRAGSRRRCSAAAACRSRSRRGCRHEPKHQHGERNRT